jgi:type I restriction enzyme R subunit
LQDRVSSSSNFGHLAELDSQLARLGALAEMFFNVDANTTLLKVRQFAEQLTIVVAARSSIMADGRDPFIDNLRRLYDDGVITREIADYLHMLRKAGNAANHQLSGERREAFDALKICHLLGVWFRITVTGKPPARRKFTPPAPLKDDPEELKTQIADLQKSLLEAESAAERAAREADEAHRSRMTAEDEAAKAAEEREVWEALALEAEADRARLGQEAARIQAEAENAPQEVDRFKKAAAAAGRSLSLDETDTRLLIDEQLRNNGWDVDSQTLRYSLGARPAKGRNMAIAEWPTSSGPADYALFVGARLIAVVEAKRRRRNVFSAVDQAERYAQGIDWKRGGEAIGGPWEDYQVPFVYAANGRAYRKQIETESGIWFRDVRRPQNGKYALPDWHTPTGLLEKLEIDRAAAEADLARRNFNFCFELRPYQKKAIQAVEKGLTEDRREMLLAMATGTGKTKLAIALAYRLLDSKRFHRLCFIVDRSALGEQAYQAFDTTQMVGAKTFASIFGLKGLTDREIDRDVKVHICTIQGLVHRVLASTPEDRPPVDQYDLMIIDECHRGYLLDREMSEAEAAFRDEADYISKYRRVLEHFDATKIGLTATPALHTTDIFGHPVYRYGYREAVVDGWLIDHDPPHLITTALSAAGITFEEGETVEMLNTETGDTDLAELDDDLGFQVQHFNRKVLTQSFNDAIAAELVKRIDPWFDGKTLIFAASDRHADQVADALLRAYREAGQI